MKKTDRGKKKLVEKSRGERGDKEDSGGGEKQYGGGKREEKGKKEVWKSRKWKGGRAQRKKE